MAASIDPGTGTGTATGTPALAALPAALLALQSRGVARRGAFLGGRRLFLAHLDGVSRPVLERALAAGQLPFLAGALASGRLVLESAYSGAPASTAAFEAALLYGDRGDVPGFLWYDKRAQRDVRLDAPAECLRLEQELERRNPPGLLTGGSTYGTMISGGASAPSISTSRLALAPSFEGADQKNGWDLLATALSVSLPAARAAVGMTTRAGMQAWDSLWWSLRVGKLRHEPMFLRNRVFLAELIREFTTHLALLDVVRGVPVIYTCYAGYDEVAHRRGPLHEEALLELAVADRALADLSSAMEARPDLGYELFVFSDHGQEPTRPIEQLLRGPNLADWILAADARGQVDPAAVQRLAVERLHRERVAALPFQKAQACGGRLLEGGGDSGRPPIVTVDGGDLAHVYFTDEAEPLELGRIAARWPARLRAVLDCPASGIVAVRGGTRGFAFVRGKRLDLAEPGALDGVLGYRGGLLADYIATMLATPSAGDLVVYGAGVRGGDVAYAWEFGSHGGVGLGDVETFLIRPAASPSPGRVEGPLDLRRYFTTRFVPARSGPEVTQRG